MVKLSMGFALWYQSPSLRSFPQRYTQSNGRRPFGISALIVGFDFDGTPRLYQTDPSGTYHAWKVKCWAFLASWCLQPMMLQGPPYALFLYI